MRWIAAFAHLWGTANDWLAVRILPAVHWANDATRYIRREWRRRGIRHADTRRRLSLNPGGKSPLAIIAAIPETEYAPKHAGQHRDKRGWRYPPKVWTTLAMQDDEREGRLIRAQEEAMWERKINLLMSEIRAMLENPPSPETYHECNGCTCNAVDRWREMVNA